MPPSQIFYPSLQSTFYPPPSLLDYLVPTPFFLFLWNLLEDAPDVFTLDQMSIKSRGFIIGVCSIENA